MSVTMKTSSSTEVVKESGIDVTTYKPILMHEGDIICAMSTLKRKQFHPQSIVNSNNPDNLLPHGLLSVLTHYMWIVLTHRP